MIEPEKPFITMIGIIWFLLLRVLLPLSLIFVTLARPAGISLTYMVMFFISPYLIKTKSSKQLWWLNCFLISMLVLSSLFFLGHMITIIANIWLVFSDTCIEWKPFYILRQIGFIGLKKQGYSIAALWAMPDIFAFAMAILIYHAAKKLTEKQEERQIASEADSTSLKSNFSSRMKHKELNRLLILEYIRSVLTTSPFLSIITLFLAGIFRPSIPSSFYFILFLLTGTYWAIYKSVNRHMRYPLIVMDIALVLHIVCLLVYQLPLSQNYVKSDELWARLTGMEALILSTCKSQVLKIKINDKLRVDSYLNPVALMLAYFVITLTLVHRTRFELSFKDIRQKMEPKSFSEAESLATPIAEHYEKSDKLQEEPSMLEQFFYMLYDITALIYKNSYILLNIVMMIWSIVFHSWLTFVLLIWANILWMIPNQRHSMQRSSFFVVLYAEFLVIAEYIYGMNLNEQELPSRVRNVNLEQIGFIHPQKYHKLPCQSLALKSGFTVIFWITSRQYFKEKIKAHGDLLRQVFGHRSSTTSHQTIFEKSHIQLLMVYLVESIRNFITRIWMWILIFLIFMCSMVERNMTAFRICYMSLFLLFFMIFQMSLRLWLKFLYGYWIFLIFYAMTILTVIYTYQFDNFDYYWHKYLNVQPKLQSDIGLHRYETKDLFLNLLIPTLTVIFTVMQLHYFHRHFIRSVREPINLNNATSHSSLRSMRFSKTKVQGDQTEKKWTYIFKAGYRKLRNKVKRLFKPVKMFVWKFLQLHMIKAVLLASFVCAVSEISFFNIFHLFLTLLCTLVSRFIRRIIFRLITFWISVLVLMKMIYQVNHISHERYNCLCDNATVSFGEWLGLLKADEVWGSLVHYLSPYLIYLILTSMHAVVKLREHLINYTLHIDHHHKLMFPGIVREHAEGNLSDLFKYLCNYGFYKFGLEITLIALVVTITYRRDVISLTYILWLILLLCFSRANCARVWNVLQLYFILMILAQYFFVLGFPPNLCLLEPFYMPGETVRMEIWQLLPTHVKDYFKWKLIIDFIVLLIISRQRKAFRTEKNHLAQENYPGGDNKIVVNLIANLGRVFFDNPTHDFCSYVRNYADVLKTAVFCSFFWITLAVVFMAGVCSMDLLSLGYLIFALVFLLQGSNMYLLDINTILCRWYCLLAFNVANIAIKTVVIFIGSTFHLNDWSLVHYLIGAVRFVGRNCTLTKAAEGATPMSQQVEYHYGPRALLFENTMSWHAIAFAFIIFQRRIFRSYYFCHIILDTQANTLLASRGAAVIEHLRYKQIYDRREHEEIVLEKVKAKMERIRAANRNNLRKRRTTVPVRVQYYTMPSGKSMYGSDELISADHSRTEHYFARIPQVKRRDLRLHPHAVRSGDYYMFEQLDDDDDYDTYMEQDFLDKEELRAHQIFRTSRTNHERKSSMRSQISSQVSLYEDSTDSDDLDFYQHPVIKLTSDLVVLLTVQLNNLSRNYRFVHKVLSVEKKALQEIRNINRLSLSNTAGMFRHTNQSLYTEARSTQDLYEGKSASLLAYQSDFAQLEHNKFSKMCIAFWYAIIGNTEIMCYIAVAINQSANSSIISLPLPFFVFCWGSLSLPRPTKTFWVTMIAYTLALIITKMVIVLAQNVASLELPLNVNLGLIMKHENAGFDLLLIVVLFWHRHMLIKQGIWNVQNDYTPPKIIPPKTISDVRENIREDAGSDTNRSRNVTINEIEDDINEVLQTVENKYVYNNVESLRYREAMESWEDRGGIFYRIYRFFFALRFKARLSKDVYALLFMCDFINFFVLLFGFPQFTYRYKYNESVIGLYFKENRVPVAFLIMLIVQFLTILIERAIYLRKALLAKIIFHLITIIGIHIWMFFLVPSFTSRSFGAPAQVTFYLIKCLHMILSAYQIRCGYPRRIMGNVFTKSYTVVNLVAFKVFLEIPFLYILRTMLDWVCIDTTLNLMEWIKMEDIFQAVFVVRCYRQMDIDFPVLRGEEKTRCTKLSLGGTIIFVLIILIWLPLLVFALVGTVGEANIPQKSDITVQIGHYEPIYTSSSYSNIYQFNDDDLQVLTDTFVTDDYASDHIMIYDAVDIAAVGFDANSVSLWNMSPPDKARLMEDIKKGNNIGIRLTLSITRSNAEKIQIETSSIINKTDTDTREALMRVISGNNNEDIVIIYDILPKFAIVQNLQMNIKIVKDFDQKWLRPIVLQKKSAEGKIWWEVHDLCKDSFAEKVLSKLPLSDCNGGLVFYTFNDKSFPSTMSFLAQLGIIGLYTTFVFLVSRVIRSVIANNHRRIMFEDLPYVDRLLKLLYDIYLVRETREYKLEEDLYAKLIFLYRSPETLIKWTRFREDFPEESYVASSRHPSRAAFSDNDLQAPTSTPAPEPNESDDSDDTDQSPDQSPDLPPDPQQR